MAGLSPTASRHRALPTLPPCCAPRAHLPAPAYSCTSHRWRFVSSEDLAWRRRPQAAPARRFVAASASAACSARLVWLRRPLSPSSSSPTLVCGLSLPTPGCLLPSSLCMLCMVAGPRQRLPSSTVAQRWLRGAYSHGWVFLFQLLNLNTWLRTCLRVSAAALTCPHTRSHGDSLKVRLVHVALYVGRA